MLTDYEKLLQLAHDAGVQVDEKTLKKDDPLDGLYVQKTNG